tara:strand:- start:1478 stop:1981 length:504 start_codon:yes stop_codon:yes gene_type:complete
MGIDITVQDMQTEDTDRVVNIITAAINKDEGTLARRSFEFHNFCREHGKEEEDGRTYYVAKLDDQVVGITGYYSNLWGERDVGWLGFFAVDPKFQGRGIGQAMMEKTIEMAEKADIKRLYIETHNTADYAKGWSFYEKLGFVRVGNIIGHKGKGIDMVVYGMDLTQS